MILDPEMRAEAVYEFYIAHREGLKGSVADMPANGRLNPRGWCDISDLNRAALILACQDLAELESLP